MHEGGPVHIVKRSGQRHTEPFDREKLQKSIVAACLSSGVPTGHAENIGRRVSEEVVIWLEDKPEVTSHDLRRIAGKHLRTHHPDAAYLYEQHRSTL